MLIIGTFKHSIELEQVLTVLEQIGIPREHIMVVPMGTYPQPPLHYMNKLPDLYAKGMEVGMACATASTIVGTSIGFILEWGPIFWGLLASVIGFSIAFGSYLLINRGAHRRLPKRLPEITVIVQCPPERIVQIMEAMWQYGVLTVGQAPQPS
jgi:hypothetical protein